MMNRKEFKDYLAENIKDYLPNDYENAFITFNDVVKNNDIHLTGITIARPGEQVVPNIYIENFWEDYQNGADINFITAEIADMRIEYADPGINVDVMDNIMNYDVAKENLQIRLCDTLENQDRLKGLVHTEHSDYSATYHVVIEDNGASLHSAPVTQDLLSKWGISVEQLHSDALTADVNRTPMLCDMNAMMESMFFGSEPTNLLDMENADVRNPFEMFCFTNESKTYGSSLILQEDLLQQIAEVVGGNYYILPSSTHESATRFAV